MTSSLFLNFSTCYFSSDQSNIEIYINYDFLVCGFKIKCVESDYIECWCLVLCCRPAAEEQGRRKQLLFHFMRHLVIQPRDNYLKALRRLTTEGVNVIQCLSPWIFYLASNSPPLRQDRSVASNPVLWCLCLMCGTPYLHVWEYIMIVISRLYIVEPD